MISKSRAVLEPGPFRPSRWARRRVVSVKTPRLALVAHLGCIAWERRRLAGVNLCCRPCPRSKHPPARRRPFQGIPSVITVPLGRPLALVSLFIFLAFEALAAAHAPATSLEELQKQLAEHVSQPKFKAAIWGLKIVSLDSGKTIFEHNAQKLFSPASNSKLYTVALALDRLGADYRVRTSVY